MMGFKAVISKKSTNKSKMIAERFSNWLKEKETHQVFYIVPDHIKFTAEMEMIRNVGELLLNSTNRSYGISFVMKLLQKNSPFQK